MPTRPSIAKHCDCVSGPATFTSPPHHCIAVKTSTLPDTLKFSASTTETCPPRGIVTNTRFSSAVFAQSVVYTDRARNLVLHGREEARIEHEQVTHASGSMRGPPAGFSFCSAIARE